MTSRLYLSQSGFVAPRPCVLLVFAGALFAANTSLCKEEPQAELVLRDVPCSRAELKLQGIPFRIVYETYRRTNGRQNWELYLIDADGSHPVNLTRTAHVDEMYPHVSPDGGKICFVADELLNDKKIRNVHYMSIDGTGRVRVAENARQPCWSPDGRTIAYLKGEFGRYTTRDFATKGIFLYDLKTRKHREHANKSLHHLYNICWSPDGNWFLATVHGGMGFKHAVLAIEADGTRVFDLTKYKVTGCRPDLNYNGTKVTWGKSDCELCVGDIELSAPGPRVTNVHCVVKCRKDSEVYHSDFSPDGRYIAFSHGPKADEQVGCKAPGWDICISDMSGKYVEITTDGNHNKEPDWVPIRSLIR